MQAITVFADLALLALSPLCHHENAMPHESATGMDKRLLPVVTSSSHYRQKIKDRKSMYHKTLAAAACLMLTIACTPRADSIPPVSMTGAFDGMSCNQAVAALNEERVTLARLEQQQNSAATADAVGVFLVLVPVSKLTGGDRAGELGASKGKVLALEQRVSRCT